MKIYAVRIMSDGKRRGGRVTVPWKQIRQYLNQRRRLVPGKFETTCWEWDNPEKTGYGVVTWNYRKYRTHRISWIIYRGKIPNGKMVCHKCDNKACFNPDHLFLGDARANALDAISKGKLNPKHGENHGMSKLSEESVVKIRKIWNQGKLDQSEIAGMFNVSRANISMIVNRITWNHI